MRKIDLYLYENGEKIMRISTNQLLIEVQKAHSIHAELWRLFKTQIAYSNTHIFDCRPFSPRAVIWAEIAFREMFGEKTCQ